MLMLPEVVSMDSLQFTRATKYNGHQFFADKIKVVSAARQSSEVEETGNSASKCRKKS